MIIIIIITKEINNSMFAGSTLQLIHLSEKGIGGQPRHSLPAAEDHKRRLNTCYEGVQVELDVKRYSLQPRMHLIKGLKNPG